MFNFYAWKQEAVGDYHEMAHIWGKDSSIWSARFSRFVLFKSAASTMQKNTLSAASVFVSEGLFIYNYFLLFEENHQNRISRAGEKNFFNDFALYS